MSTWCWDSELGQLLDGIMKQSDLTPLKRTETRTGNLIPHHPYPEPYIWPKRFWPQPVLSWNSQLLPRTAQPDSCLWLFFCYVGLPWWIVGKEPTCSAEDPGSIPGWGRSPGEGNGNPLQYSCLENPMDRAAWRATVHEVSESQTWLSSSTTFCYVRIFAGREELSWLFLWVPGDPRGSAHPGVPNFCCRHRSPIDLPRVTPGSFGASNLRSVSNELDLWEKNT